MWDWITNLFNDGSGANVAAGGAGMMAGVPGFDPSDPGAYANRTAGDADMGGYGGSPRLPDARTADWGGLSRAGADLMALGAPQGGGMSWRPTPSPVGRGNPAFIQQLSTIFQPARPMMAPPALGGLLSEGQQPPNDPRRRMAGLFDFYG